MTKLRITNSAPAWPTNRTVVSGFMQNVISFDMPTDQDFAGVLIWASKTYGFTPSSSNLIFDGKADSFVHSPLGNNETWYYKIAAYDTFGKSYAGTGLNIAPQLSGVTISKVGIPASSSDPSGGAVGDTYYNTTTKQLMRFDGTNWVSAINQADIPLGGVDTAQLADNAVKAAKIPDLEILGGKLANLAVTNAKIADATILGDKVAANTISANNLIIKSTGKYINADPDCTDIKNYYQTGCSIITVTSLAGAKTGIENITGARRDITTSEYITIDSSKNYRLSVAAIQDSTYSTTATGYFGIIWYDANNTIISSSAASGWPVNGTYNYFGVLGTAYPTTWTEYSIDFGDDQTAKIPATARKCKLVALTNFNNTAGARIVISKWRLEEKIYGELLVDGAITSQKLYTGAVIADKIAAGAVSTEKLVVKSNNLSINIDPYFTDSTAWTTTSSAVVFATGAGNVGSTSSNFVYCESGINQYVYSKNIIIDPNKTYYLSASLWADTGNDRNMYIFIDMYDVNDVRVATNWGGSLSGYVFGELPTIGQFTKYGAQIGANTSKTIPSNVKYCRIGVWFRYSGNGTNTNIRQAAQNLRLTEAATAELIVDGSITTNKLVAEAVTASKIKAKDITADQIAVNTITTSEIKAGTIKAANIESGTITGLQIAGTTITGSHIVGGSITADKVDTRGLTIKDSSGNIVFSSGGVDYNKVTGTTRPEDNATVGADWTANTTNKPSNINNLIVKNDFSDGTAGGWNCEIAIATGQTFAKCLQNNVRDALEVGNVISVTPGEIYVVSAIIKTTALYTSTLGLRFDDKSGNVIGWYGGFTAPANNGSFIQYNGTITVPAGAVKAYPWFQIACAVGATTTDYAYFANPVIQVSTTTVQAAATTATWTGVSSMPNNVYALTGTEPIQNSLIEVGATNLWKNSTKALTIMSGTGTSSLVSMTLPDGTTGNALRVVNSGATTVTCRVYNAVRQNDVYSLSLYHKLAAAGTWSFDVCDSNATTVNATTSWQYYKKEGFTISNYSLAVYNFVDINIPAGATLDLWHPQIEYGNKASDWKYAVEDIDSNITVAGTTATWAGIPSGSGKPADNATNNPVYVQSATPTGSEGAVWVDTTNASVPVTKIYKSGAWTIGANKTTEVGGSGVNYAHPRYSNFEESTLPPVTYANCAVALDTTTGMFGSNSLKIYNVVNSDGYCYLNNNGSGLFPIPAGQKWILSAYVKVTSTANLELMLFLPTSNVHVSGSTTVSSTTWQRISYVLDLSAYPDTSAMIRLDNNAGSCTAYFDGIMLEPMIGTNTTPSPYQKAPNFLETYIGALDANKTYVDGSGTIQGVASGAGTAVSNSLLVPSINQAATTANWSGIPSGTGKPEDYANKTYVDGSGNLQGVSSGAGTAVQNSLLTPSITNAQTSANLAAISGGNIIHKSYFEDLSVGGWSGSYVETGNYFINSKRYIVLLNLRDCIESDGYMTPVNAGETLYAGMYAYTGGSAYAMTIGVVCYDKSGTVINWLGIASLAAGTGWTKIDGSGVVPANTAYVRPWIQVNGPAGSTGTCAANSMYICRAQNGATVGADWKTNTTNIPYASVYNTDDGSALSVNGAFSAWSGTYPDGWVNWVSTPPTKDTTGFTDGTAAAKFTSANSASGMQTGILSLPSPSSGGSGAVVGVSMNISSWTSGPAGILVRLYTNAAFTTYYDTVIAVTGLTNGWTRKNVIAQLANNTDQIYGIRIYCMASWTGLGSDSTLTVSFKNISLQIIDNKIQNKAVGLTDNAGVFSIAPTSAGATVTAITPNNKITNINVGTYMGSAAIGTAYIADLAVTNAKINDLNAAKITAGYIDAARISAGSIDATKITQGGVSSVTSATNFSGSITFAGGNSLFDFTAVAVAGISTPRPSGMSTITSLIMQLSSNISFSFPNTTATRLGVQIGARLNNSTSISLSQANYQSGDMLFISGSIALFKPSQYSSGKNGDFNFCRPLFLNNSNLTSHIIYLRIQITALDDNGTYVNLGTASDTNTIYLTSLATTLINNV